MIYYGDKDSRDYLAHYGVVGMKWGIRRYQPYSYTGARKGGKTGKEIGIAGKLGNGIKSTAKKVKKFVDTASKEHAEKSVERKEKRAAKKEERWLKKKDKILKSGSTAQVLKISNKLSDQEISGAANRIRNEMTLRDLQDQESRRSIERGTKAIRSMVDLGQTIYSGYQLVDNIQNINRVKEQRRRDDERAKRQEAQDLRNEIINKRDFEDKQREWAKADAKRELEDYQKAAAERQRRVDGGVRPESIERSMIEKAISSGNSEWLKVNRESLSKYDEAQLLTWSKKKTYIDTMLGIGGGKKKGGGGGN